MRIIDEKGRFLNFMNIFDLLFIILIFCMMIPAGLFYYHHRAHKQPGEAPQQYSHVYKYAKAQAYLIQGVADRLKKGDRLLDSDGNALWEIDSVSNRPAVVGTAPKKPDAKISTSASHTKSYSLARNGGVIKSLGEAYDREEPETVEISSLRNMEISLKLWCRIEKDGSLIICKDGTRLLAGTTLQLSTNSYNIIVTISDVA